MVSKGRAGGQKSNITRVFFCEGAIPVRMNGKKREPGRSIQHQAIPSQSRTSPKKSTARYICTEIDFIDHFISNRRCLFRKRNVAHTHAHRERRARPEKMRNERAILFHSTRSLAPACPLFAAYSVQSSQFGTHFDNKHNTTNTRQSMKEGRNGGGWFWTFTFIHVCNVRYSNSVCLSPPLSLAWQWQSNVCKGMVSTPGMHVWHCYPQVNISLSLSLSCYIYLVWQMNILATYVGYSPIAHSLIFVHTTHPSIRRLFAALLASSVPLCPSSLLLSPSFVPLPKRNKQYTKKRDHSFLFLFSPHLLAHPHSLSFCSIHNSPHSTPFHIQFRKERRSPHQLWNFTSLSHTPSLSHSFSLIHTLTVSHPHHVSPFFLSCFLIILSTPLQYGENHIDPVVFAFFPVRALKGSRFRLLYLFLSSFPNGG